MSMTRESRSLKTA